MDYPPGLYEPEVNALLTKLRRPRAALRVARYYDGGHRKTVVYEVLDENETPILDEKKRIWDLHTAYPSRLEELPIGTVIPIGGPISS